MPSLKKKVYIKFLKMGGKKGIRHFLKKYKDYGLDSRGLFEKIQNVIHKFQDEFKDEYNKYDAEDMDQFDVDAEYEGVTRLYEMVTKEEIEKFIIFLEQRSYIPNF